MSSSTSNSSLRDMKRFALKACVFVSILALLYAPAYLASTSGMFDGTYITTQAYKLAQMREGADYDVVIMGDSCAMAIDPTDPQTARLLPGRTVYNFGLVNLGGMYPVYSTLKKYVSAGKSPKLILLSFLPSLLTSQPDILDGSKFTRFYAAKFYSFEELLTDAEISSHRVAQAQLLVEKLKLRFVQDRYDIPYSRGMFERVKEKNGQMLILEDTRATEEEVRAAPQFRNDFRPSPRALKYLSEFLKLARERGSEVIIFTMPEPETAFRARMASGYFAKYFEALRELERQHPNLSVIETPFSFPNEYFSADVTHLNRSGAQKFLSEQWPIVLRRANALLAERDKGFKRDADDSLAETPTDSLRPGALPKL